MRHALPALDSLKAFEAAARHGSFTLAADELCLSKGAISYQIKKLEEQISCTLFLRSVRQVELTDAGRALLKTTQQVFRELETVMSQLQGSRDTLGATIGVTTYVAARWLSSRISLFTEQHPHIELAFEHAVNDADFLPESVDLLIQWGPCAQPQEEHCIGQLPMALFPAVSPVLLARHGITDMSAQPARELMQGAFKEIPLLCEERQQDLWQEWIAATQGKKADIPANPRRVISDANVRVQAAIDGQGMILADNLMKRELQQGLLTVPFEGELDGYGYRFLCAGVAQSTVHAVLRTWVSSWLV